MRSIKIHAERSTSDIFYNPFETEKFNLFNAILVKRMFLWQFKINRLLVKHREYHDRIHCCHHLHAGVSTHICNGKVKSMRKTTNSFRIYANTYFAGSVKTIRSAFCPSSVLLSIEYRPVNVFVMALIFVSSVKNRFKMPGLAKACCTFFVPAKW